MEDIRKAIRKLILEECEPGANFDTDTGMPCTTNANHWMQYMQDSQKEHQQNLQNIMNQFQQDIEKFDDAQEAVEDTVEEKAQEDENWQKPWERMTELHGEYDAERDRFSEWYRGKQKELHAMVMDVIPYGKVKQLDYCNKWLKSAQVDTVDRPLPYGQLLAKVIAARAKIYQDLFHDEIDDIADFYHKKFMKAIDGGISVEKVEKISKIKLDDLLNFEKKYKAELDKLFQIYTSAVEKAKKEGKGWAVDKNGKQFQLER